MPTPPKGMSYDDYYSIFNKGFFTGLTWGFMISAFIAVLVITRP